MFYIIKVKGLFCIFVTIFNVDSLCNTDRSEERRVGKECRL